MSPLASSRDVASISPSNKEHFAKAKRAKFGTLLKVELDQPGLLPEDEEQEVILVGHLQTGLDSTQTISYEWLLPQGVIVVDGASQGQINDTRPGEALAVRLVVKGFTRHLYDHVVLKASIHLGQTLISNVATIASNPEESLEYLAPEMKKASDTLRAEASFR